VGPDSRVRREENVFESSEFTIDTRSNTLVSPRDIKSILKPKENSVLFSRDELFVHAKKIRIFTRENKIQYTDAIRLYQGDTVLRAGSLEFEENSRVLAQGKVFLSFKENEDSIVLQGERILFDPAEKQIKVDKKGLLQSGTHILRAEHITIEFNEQQELERILADTSVTFNKDKITGNSKNVVWRFKEDLMTFQGNARIKTQSGGVTKGEELLLNLKEEKITILSDQSGRSQTVID
jgi:lipopolysaccharide export system protein LptA